MYEYEEIVEKISGKDKYYSLIFKYDFIEGGNFKKDIEKREQNN